MPTRTAVDIGGTFTDLVYLDTDSGRIGLGKRSTTPAAFEEGVIKILPVLTSFEPFPTECFWVGATLIQLTVPAIVIGKAVDALKQAERKNFAQAWRLRQLVPGDSLDGSIAPAARTVPST